MTRTLLAALLLAAPAAAQEGAPDAVLAKVSGRVTIIDGATGRRAPAKGGEALIYGDAVRTGPASVAQIVLQDRGAVLVRENTLFGLSGTPRRTLIDFARGEFLIGLKRKLGRGESFRVRTPAAVAAVRGTLFWGRSGADKATTYAGFGHKIAVTAQGKTVTVEAGQTVTIPFGEAPGEVKPHEIPVEYAHNFAVDGDLQGLDQLVDLPK